VGNGPVQPPQHIGLHCLKVKPSQATSSTLVGTLGQQHNQSNSLSGSEHLSYLNDCLKVESSGPADAVAKRLGGNRHRQDCIGLFTEKCCQCIDDNNEEPCCGCLCPVCDCNRCINEQEHLNHEINASSLLASSFLLGFACGQPDIPPPMTVRFNCLVTDL